MSEEAQNIDVEITEEKIEKAALPENRSLRMSKLEDEEEMTIQTVQSDYQLTHQTLRR